MRVTSGVLAAAVIALAASRVAVSAPLQSTPVWTAESNQVGANLGVSTITAGDVNGDGFSDVIVGAFLYDNGNTNEGRALLYLGGLTGPSPTPAWVTEGNQENVAYGASVAPAGDVNGDGFDDVLVGSPQFSNGEVSEGRAFLYLGSSTGLSTTAAWTAEANQAGAAFGADVAPAGDVNGDGFADVIVAAPSFDGSVADAGRAFVYLGSASGLGTTAAWTFTGDQAGAGIGMMVAPAGDADADGFDDVLVGVPLYDNGETDEGRALLFRGSASGVSVTATWTSEGNQLGANFGASLACAGDVNGDGYGDVIVGAPLFDNVATDEGSASVFLGSASGPGTTAAWVAVSPQAGAQFGSAVATAGDLTADGYADVIVGAYQFANGESAEGRASAFEGGPDGLSTLAAWTAESNQVGAGFGRAVGTAGDTNGDGWSDVIIGAGGYDNGQDGEGRAFVFTGVASAVGATPAFTIRGKQFGASMGFRAATVGDVNGDGFSDIMFSARLYDDGNVDEGKVELYYGSAAGLDTIPVWVMESDQDSAEFGTSIGTAGDVNGDGYADVVLSSRLYDHPEHDEGAAYLYLGGPSGLASTPAWSVEADQADAILHSINTAGDVNGDGYSDVVVGAYQYDNGNFDEGKVWLYLGGPSGLSTTPSWTTEGDADSANYGFKVATAGDVNGDGYSDFLVGAWLFNAGLPRQGKAYLYLGGPSGPSTTPAWTILGTTAWSQMGIWVGTAGDVNADGYSDVVIGANRSQEGGNNAGRAYCFLGSASGLSTTPQWTVTGTTFDFLGTVAMVGDINGDGFSDVAVGAPMYGNPEFDEGVVRTYLGGPTGLSSTPVWTFESNVANARLGEAVAPAGDINGDGYDDMVVGGDGWRNPIPEEGQALVFYGNATAGRSRVIRQTRLGSTATLALLGTSDSPSSFALRGHARSAAGRARVAIEYQVAQGAGTFTNVPRVRGAWVQTNAPAAGDGSTADITEIPGGLATGSLYRWRARFVSTSPLFPHSTWQSPPLNGRTEAHVRTAFTVDASAEDPRTTGGLRVTPSVFTREVYVEYRAASPAAREQLVVTDVAGRRVATLTPVTSSGTQRLAVWDGHGVGGRPVSAGVYLVRLTQGDRVQYGRVVKHGP